MLAAHREEVAHGPDRVPRADVRLAAGEGLGLGCVGDRVEDVRELRERRELALAPFMHGLLKRRID